MNYNVISLNPVTDEEVPESDIELFGQPYRLTITVIYDECLVYMHYYCGSKAGVQLDPNVITKAYPNLDFEDISATIAYDFPYIIDKNLYAEHTRAAVEYLRSQGITAISEGTNAQVEINNITIAMTRRDIIYFAELA